MTLFIVKAVLNQPVTTETVQLAGAVASEVVTQEGVETEEAATIVSAEDGKQLVAIGDGQFVELPEGYTLIQTDDGYLIGQAGATFVQVRLETIDDVTSFVGGRERCEGVVLSRDATQARRD